MKRIPVLFALSIVVFIGVQSARQPEHKTPQNIESATIKNQVTALHRVAETLYVGFGDGRLEKWRLNPKVKDVEFVAHDGAIRRIKSDSASKNIITIGARGSVARWDKDFKLIKRHRFTDRHLNDGLVLTSGGIMVAGDKGYIAKVGPDPWRIVGMHNLAVFGLESDPRSQTIFSVGSDNQVGFWSAKTGSNLAHVPVGTDWIQTINRIGDSLWLGNKAGHLHRLVLSSKSVQSPLKIGTSRIISTAVTDEHLALGFEDGQLSIVNTHTQKTVYTGRVFDTPVYAIAFYNGGVILGSTGPTMRFMPDYDKPAIEDF